MTGLLYRAAQFRITSRRRSASRMNDLGLEVRLGFAAVALLWMETSLMVQRPFTGGLLLDPAERDRWVQWRSTEEKVQFGLVSDFSRMRRR
jgi:hypothetical protein